jgi:hypothetical protein
MAGELNFNCAATMIGSVPYTDPAAACAVITKYLKDWPAWPQLPFRANLENMYIQYSQGFPGIKVDGQKISYERRSDADQLIERIISDSLDDKYNDYAVSKEYAAGLDYCIGNTGIPLAAVKGQVTGPVSWGLCVTDHEGRGIIYDEMLAETAARFLRLKASWQEAELRKRAKNTLIFIDEPYLTSLGSAFVSLSNEVVASLLAEVLGGVKGLKGIHCCGSTDWSLLLGLELDVINFDAYNYLDSFLTYPSAINSFLDKGGAIAWGVVPNDEDTLKKESLAQLYDRLCEAINKLVRPRFTFKDLVRRSLVTPTCGLTALLPESAEFVFSLLKELSEKVGRKYSS